MGPSWDPVGTQSFAVLPVAAQLGAGWVDNTLAVAHHCASIWLASLVPALAKQVDLLSCFEFKKAIATSTTTARDNDTNNSDSESDNNNDRNSRPSSGDSDSDKMFEH